MKASDQTLVLSLSFASYDCVTGGRSREINTGTRR